MSATSFGRSLVLSVILVTTLATSQEKPCENCGKPNAWQDFNRIVLAVKSPADQFSAKYDGVFDKETNDIQVDVETTQGGKSTQGKLLMIGGRILATQGPITKPGYEIDALDGAVLEWQLVTKLLARVAPQWIASDEASKQINYSETKDGVHIATASAEGMIQAPWHLVGELTRRESNSIAYDLTLTSPGFRGEKENTLVFSGKFQSDSSSKISDELSLKDWTVFGIGPQSRTQGGSTTFDYSAAATSAYRTVADVRKKLAGDDNPGQKDESKDFSGFWKTDCDNAFGMRIQHVGNDGKYAVVFCGPGGCMNDYGRKTFITQDSHYHVVSESEIRITTSAGWQTYRRCTKDTNPVLKYKE
jgi:hypothetical protein